MIKQFSNLLAMMQTFPDEQSCIDHLRSIHWENGAFCPHCGSTKIYHFSDKRTHKCGDCRQRFSIKVGTIFEDSKIELRKWFMAIYLMTSHKKGIASTQLAKDIGVTQKTAWFMLHRLRYAAETRSFKSPLKGEIEVDETFMGGKEKNKHARKRKHLGTGGAGKTAVMGLLERGGDLRAEKVENVKAATLHGKIAQHIAPGSLVVTDEWPGYNGLGGKYRHERVRHSAHEYARGKFHTNGIEGAWSHFKRQVYGIHHWISPKHLDRYLDEFTYRFNRRGIGEGERMNDFLTRVAGRLSYRELIA